MIGSTHFAKLSASLNTTHVLEQPSPTDVISIPCVTFAPGAQRPGDDHLSGPVVPIRSWSLEEAFPAPLSRSRARVLLADEDPAILHTLANIMSMIGFPRLDLVFTGTDTLSTLCSKHYDIVILDVEMKGPSGFYLARSLRMQCAGNKRVQPLVIVCTGRLPFSYEQTAICNGADYAFYKPLSRDILHRAFTENAIF